LVVGKANKTQLNPSKRSGFCCFVTMGSHRVKKEEGRSVSLLATCNCLWHHLSSLLFSSLFQTTRSSGADRRNGTQTARYTRRFITPGWLSSASNVIYCTDHPFPPTGIFHIPNFTIQEEHGYSILGLLMQSYHLFLFLHIWLVCIMRHDVFICREDLMSPFLHKENCRYGNWFGNWYDDSF